MYTVLRLLRIIPNSSCDHRPLSSDQPSVIPSNMPSSIPSKQPSTQPSAIPSLLPSSEYWCLLLLPKVSFLAIRPQLIMRPSLFIFRPTLSNPIEYAFLHPVDSAKQCVLISCVHGITSFANHPKLIMRPPPFIFRSTFSNPIEYAFLDPVEAAKHSAQRDPVDAAKQSPFRESVGQPFTGMR